MDLGAAWIWVQIQSLALTSLVALFCPSVPWFSTLSNGHNQSLSQSVVGRAKKIKTCMTLSARLILKAVTPMVMSIITTIMVTERPADNGPLGQATPGWGRPCDGGIKRPRCGVRGLGWNACSGTYSIFSAHAHVNWANSSMCICYKEEEKVNR